MDPRKKKKAPTERNRKRWISARCKPMAKPVPYRNSICRRSGRCSPLSTSMVQSRRAKCDASFVATPDALLIGMCPSGRIVVATPRCMSLCGTFAGGGLLSRPLGLTVAKLCRSPESKLTLCSLGA